VSYLYPCQASAPGKSRDGRLQTPAEFSKWPDQWRRVAGLVGARNSSVQWSRKSATAREAAGTTGSNQKTAAREKLLGEGIRKFAKKAPEGIRRVRRAQSLALKACLSHPQEKSAVTPKHLPWRDCSPGGKNLSPRLNLAQPCKGYKAEKGRDRNKPTSAIAASRNARENEWTDASRPGYDDSRNVRRGQVDASSVLRNSKKGGDGDRSQGCTDPRGRTLREDQARSVSQGGVTSE
jgi:hypothetical protein